MDDHMSEPDQSTVSIFFPNFIYLLQIFVYNFVTSSLKG